MPSTLKLSDSINYAQPFVGFAPLTIGANNEPAVSAANAIKQAMLAPPMCYRWNRATTSFLTVTGQQDYSVAGLTSFGFAECASVQKVASITSASLTNNVATYVCANSFSAGDTITTLGCLTTALNVPSQTVVSASPSQFTTALNHPDIPSESEMGGSPPASFATASLIQDAAGRPGIFPLDIKSQAVGEAVEQDRPHNLFVQTDDNAGNIKFRTTPVADQQYQIIVTYQQSASLFASTGDKWSPIPDWMEYIFNAGFLSLVMDAEDDQKAMRYRQIFVAGVLANAEGLSEMDRDVFVRTWLPGATDAQVAALSRQQGVAARGI